MKKFFILGFLLATRFLGAHAEVDPNFYIYLCFGQSNMEGNAAAETVDTQNVDKRFLMLATPNFSTPKRELGKWYIATPPIVSPSAGLGMADYFGRTMVAALPSNVRVGVVDVAVGGIAIEGFMQETVADIVKNAPDWQKTLLANYGNDPFKRLVDMAKVAQESGVIKGILLHQGCSNNGDPNWPNNVKKIYARILNELGLRPDSVPLFVGETLRKEHGGACYGHNEIIAKMPSVIPNSHVISSLGCVGNGADPWHFNAVGYRIMGKRYAYAALQALGRETKADPAYDFYAPLRRFYTPSKFDSIITQKANTVFSLRLLATFMDNHRENLTEETTFTSDDFTITKGQMKLQPDSRGTVKAVYTDFLGTRHEINMTVGTPSAITTIEADARRGDVYSLQGQRVANSEQWNQLPRGLYIVDGRKRVKP